MLLIVSFVLLSGCATENPHYKNAQTIGGTVVGAVIGFKTLGGGIPGGIAGAAVGHEVAKGAQWKPGDDEIEYIDVPAGGYSSGYSSCGAVNVYCDTTPKQGMYPPRPGMCNDPDSGGEATYEDLVRRAQRRAGCYDNNSGYRAPHPQQHASYAPAQVVYPPNLWERPEKRQKTAGKKEKYDGPTINDYMSPKWAGVIPSNDKVDCRTGNYGHDSICLKSEAQSLDKKQVACDADHKKCNKDLNFQETAYYFRKLASSLELAQNKWKP